MGNRANMVIVEHGDWTLHPAGAIAGLMKLFDPSGPELEAGMNDVINSPFQPDRASWNRFEVACAQVQAVYTRSA